MLLFLYKYYRPNTKQMKILDLTGLNTFFSIEGPDFIIENPHNFEHRNFSSPMSGKNHTEKSKKKMSDGHKGNLPWNKGLIGAQIHSDETKQKISKISAGNKSRTGQTQGEEERRKRSQALKKYYAERRAQGYKR